MTLDRTRTDRWRLLGAAIPSIMGAIWIAGGLVAMGKMRAGILAWIMAATLVLLVLNVLALRRSAPPPSYPAAHPARDRIVAWAMILEGIGIAMSLALAQIAQCADIIPPLIAIVVGLHFLPLGHAFRRPALYRVAAIMVAAGVVSLLEYAYAMRVAVAALGAGAALWTGALEMAWPVWRTIRVAR